MKGPFESRSLLIPLKNGTFWCSYKSRRRASSPEIRLGFGVWGLGFGVWGLGFRVWGLGFGVWGLGFGVWGLGFRVRVWGLGFGVRGSGFGVRVHGRTQSGAESLTV